MSYKYPDASILVFCKAPIAGQVKTRLIPDLTSQQAADVHVELSERILSLLFESKLCPIQLWCSPDTTHPFFIESKDNYALTLHQQHGNDLGERMHHAISDALEETSKVLLIGCDCPSITIEDLDLAIRSIQSHNDIAIAPAEDGGYVMIGMSDLHPELFLGMTWGNSDVLGSTLKRIKLAELTAIKSRAQWDVDTVKDLKRHI